MKTTEYRDALRERNSVQHDISDWESETMMRRADGGTTRADRERLTAMRSYLATTQAALDAVVAANPGIEAAYEVEVKANQAKIAKHVFEAGL